MYKPICYGNLSGETELAFGTIRVKCVFHNKLCWSLFFNYYGQIAIYHMALNPKYVIVQWVGIRTINQSIIVFFPRAGLLLQTQHSPLYLLLSLPFRICIQSIYHDVVYHLISSSAANLLPVYHSF